MYQLLIQGGTVIDPAQGIHDRRDIGITDGKITAIAGKIDPTLAKESIDASGKLVTPGLIDYHCHVAGETVKGSQVAGKTVGGAVFPDEGGVLSGVTTVCDGGSTGYLNFADFRQIEIANAKTRVYVFLNLGARGLLALPEISSWDDLDAENMVMRQVIDENRDIIKGLKIRETGTLVRNLGIQAMRVAKKIATETQLPLMVHIGIEATDAVPQDQVDAFTRELLPLLDKGDVLTHIFTWKQGRVIGTDGKAIPELIDAIHRGVVLDVARAGNHWSLGVAKRAIDQGILPTTISTDLARRGIDGPVFSLPATMSAFFAAGLNIDQLIEMATINPARLLGEERQIGSLRVDMPADLSILELIEGEFIFEDGMPEQAFKSNFLLEPRLVIKSGVQIQAHSRFKNAAPGKSSRP